ncbi:helix-turn-helix domain-containing protein [Spirosoma foliorum]|uniref:AraC family transcriptional regulator n=1 Tax=Spirosoma foliorum TaxID=2710596 RepID=A0A7G5H1I0_9BACT|nr:helix-turn-helix domain-containing protein [Spirosoma foliorum]QMW04972.1 AraC family transcriptional regulator [Spirosoma foliorum]
MATISTNYSISDFFNAYGLGQPLHSQIMCMRLEEQPDSKLTVMPLYRSDFYRVIQFTNSQLAFTAGETRQSIGQNCLSFSYPGKLESWEREGRLYGTVIYFTQEFTDVDSTHSGFDGQYPFFTLEGDTLLSLDEAEADQLKQRAEEMIQEMQSELPDNLNMIRKLLAVYLHKIRRIYTQKMGQLPPEQKANQALFNRFRKVLDEYVGQLANGQQSVMPSVSLLADSLGISANYLNEVIKRVTSLPASAHLQRKMMLEVKSYLLHSDDQVAQIAYRFGFDNVSYFNRFFKKQTGLTPVEFRARYQS